MYVTKADYIGRISVELLDLLLAEDEETILMQSSRAAEDAIKTMAGVLYDIIPELAKVGDARNYYLLGIAKSIALYEIYNRADDEQVPEKVIKNHDDAMTELVDVSKGKQVLDLPPKPEDPISGGGGDESINPGGSGLRRMGSQPRRTHTV